jgi:hypothetical protein
VLGNLRDAYSLPIVCVLAYHVNGISSIGPEHLGDSLVYV